MTSLLVKKIADVMTPERMTADSAGIDFYCPRDVTLYGNNHLTLIPLGIEVCDSIHSLI